MTLHGVTKEVALKVEQTGSGPGMRGGKLVGFYTDRNPQPYSLPIGMGVTLLGLIVLSQASGFASLCMAAGMVGIGSSVFHPESSRVARMASGGKHGFAQSLFQVGGNFGTSLGPSAM